MTSREKIYSFLFYHPVLKKAGIVLLNSPWFVNNPIYRIANKINIRRLINMYREKPNFVFIENTNLCNSHCTLCPHDKMKRESGIMNQALFKKIIMQCKEMKIDNIGLHGFGEPFVDKDFVKKLAFAKSVGFKRIGTSTNGSLLNKRIIEQLVNLGLDEICFSLDAGSRHVYEKIRLGLSYDRVMENIAELLRRREFLHKNKPKIIVDFIETEENLAEKQDFIAKWSKLVEQVNITTLHSWGGELKRNSGKYFLHHRSKIDREPCRFLWTDMYINWDGKVNACCQDYDSKLVVGDLNKNTMIDIWQGEKLSHLRKMHLEGKADEIPVCQKCDYRSVWWLFK